MPVNGYDFTRDQIPALLVRKFFPEKTQQETLLLGEYLAAHHHEFDRISLSVRIGAGWQIDAGAPESVRRNLERSSRRRIDAVGWAGQHATLIEAKTTLSHQVLGQLVSGWQLWLEEFPNGPDPALVAVGRRATEEDLRILTAHRITVYLYATAPAE